MKLLISDLDNTLYDWVTFFSLSFTAMVKEIVALVGTTEAQVLAEFKAVHQRYGTSEPPFALLELPSAEAAFGKLSRREMRDRLKPAIAAFSEARAQHLRLYSSVRETLEALAANGTTIVGHTEAVAENAFYRLKKLGIDRYFKHLYVLEGKLSEHPDPERLEGLAPPPGVIRVVPVAERKPNPTLLRDICASEGVSPREAVYIGDSLTRDIKMANDAGVHAVWAKYGLDYDKSHWDVLVRVTHWSAEDVAREAELKKHLATIKPDLTAASFSDLLTVDSLLSRSTP